MAETTTCAIVGGGQWDLLNLLADAARAEPSFTLMMKTESTALLRRGDRVTGVRYRGPTDLANCGPH